MINQQGLSASYEYCRQVTRNHYENFPVASRLLPASIRDAISVIYAFARSADDIADEGTDTAEMRLQNLNEFQRQLDNIKNQRPVNSPIFTALQDVMQRHSLAPQLFSDLLRAFKQDVTTIRYSSFADVMQYCQYSANPIGRIVLALHAEDTQKNIEDSDRICSALQLINFYQDIEQDYLENNRIYLPIKALSDPAITKECFYAYFNSPSARNEFQEFYSGTHNLLRSGAPLGQRLSGRLGLEIRMTIWGGLRILERLLGQQHSLLTRPRLNWHDWIPIGFNSLFRLSV